MIKANFVFELFVKSDKTSRNCYSMHHSVRQLQPAVCDRSQQSFVDSLYFLLFPANVQSIDQLHPPFILLSHDVIVPIGRFSRLYLQGPLEEPALSCFALLVSGCHRLSSGNSIAVLVLTETTLCSYFHLFLVLELYYCAWVCLLE